MSDVEFDKIISMWYLSVQFGRRSMKSIREDWNTMVKTGYRPKLSNPALQTHLSEIVIKIQQFSSKKDAFENIVCEMVSILPQPQCVNADFFISEVTWTPSSTQYISCSGSMASQHYQWEMFCSGFWPWMVALVSQLLCWAASTSFVGEWRICSILQRKRLPGLCQHQGMTNQRRNVSLDWCHFMLCRIPNHNLVHVIQKGPFLGLLYSFTNHLS